MIFGNIDNPELVDFTLPQDHPAMKRILLNSTTQTKLKVFFGLLV